MMSTLNHILVVAPPDSLVAVSRPESVLAASLTEALMHLDRARASDDRIDLVVLALPDARRENLVRFCLAALSGFERLRLVIYVEPDEWEPLLAQLDGDERVAIVPPAARPDHLWRMVRFVDSPSRLQVRNEVSLQLEGIGQVTAFVAHEMNTPLQFVSDSLHHLVEGWQALSSALECYESAWNDRHPPFGVNRRDLVFYRTNLNDVSQRMSQGLKTLDELSRALRRSSPRVDATGERTDVNELVRAAVAMTRGAWRRVARLDLDLQDLPEVECLSGELMGVFINLIINATHAVEARWKHQRGNIRIATWIDGGDLCLSFGDNGCGMDDRVAKRAFDPHFSTKSTTRGTGQGLSIAKRTIEQRHRGEIDFVTSPGEGTTFSIRIPTTNRRTASEGTDDAFDASFTEDETMVHRLAVGPRAY